MTYFVIEVIASALSLIAGGLASTELVRKFVLRYILKKKDEEETHSQKLSRLRASLTEASKEVDNVLGELAQVTRDREKAVQQLETELTNLESREKQLKQTIQDLEKVPIPVAEHFAKLIGKGERRSAWRDYILFGAGVIVSTIIAIILKLAGLG